jgi:transposase
MKKASEEIRTIVVKAYLSGAASRPQLSAIFGYTPACISNWVREYKQEKRLAPRPQGHRKAVFTGAELEQLAALLRKKVDLTLAEIRDHFCKTCSLVAIHKTVVKLGFVFKKNSTGQRTRSRGYSPTTRAVARVSGEC